MKNVDGFFFVRFFALDRVEDTIELIKRNVLPVT